MGVSNPPVAGNTSGTFISGDDPRLGMLEPLTTGEENCARYFWSNINTPISGRIFFSYFTARKTETINQLSVSTASTAAGATPTLCRMGVYSVAANGDLTLVGACANDTTLFASTNTTYTRNTTASFTKTRGVQYAAAVLVVSGAAMPTFRGTFVGASGTEAVLAPRLSTRLPGQTDLPASIGNGSLIADTNYVGMILLP